MSSTDTKELAELCNRVLVMRDGLLADELSGERLSEAALVAAALQGRHVDARYAVQGG